MIKKNPLFLGTIILTSAGVISRILGFLYRIFLSNIIGAENLGIFQLVMPVFLFAVSISSGGIQIAVSRFIAENNKKREKCFSILIGSIIMTGFFSVIISAVIYVFSGYISINFLKDLRCESLLRYVTIAIPLSSLHACIVGFYLGKKNATIPSVIQIIEQIFKLLSLLIIFIVCSGNGIPLSADIAAYSFVISECAGTLFLMAFMFCNKPDKWPQFSTIFTDIKVLFSVSYILTFNKIILTLLQSVEAILIPITLVKYGMANSDAIYLYGILTGMVMPVITFPSALIGSIAMLVMPTIAEAKVSGKTATLKKTSLISTKISCLCGIGCFFIFFLFGDFIGTTIFGHSECGQYIRLISWICPFMYLSISLGSILHGLGKTTKAVIHNLISVIIRIAFLWFVVPEIGIVGYFWGLLISTLIITLLHYTEISKVIH